MKIEIDLKNKTIAIVNDHFTFEQIISDLNILFPNETWKSYKLINKYSNLDKKLDISKTGSTSTISLPLYVSTSTENFT